MNPHAQRVCVIWSDGTWEEQLLILPNPESDLRRMLGMAKYREAVDFVLWGPPDELDDLPPPKRPEDD